MDPKRKRKQVATTTTTTPESNISRMASTAGQGSPGKTKGNTGGSSLRRKRKRITWFAFVVILPLAFLAVAKNINHHYSSLQDPDLANIIENYLTLVQISVRAAHLIPNSNESRYGKIEATFCEIDWKLQESNPSNVPMFRDLKAQSKNCAKTEVIVDDFFKVVQAARAWDGQKEGNFYPKGVVFHETRCGSTLVANLLSGSSERSRVYSESPPPVTALSACQRFSCDEELHKALIKDVFYMMGRRRPSKTNNVFYKIQSIGVMSIDKFTMAFPEIPWIFVYRDTVEILQSHLKGGGPPKVCTRNWRFGENQQPPTTMEAIRASGKSLKDLNAIEYCAAHLAGLSLSAVHEQQKQKTGRFIEYTQLPEVLWEEILPEHFGISLKPANIARMETIGGVYSKGRGSLANLEWTEDSTSKQETASPEVTNAAKVFTSKVYQTMQSLSAAKGT